MHDLNKIEEIISSNPNITGLLFDLDGLNKIDTIAELYKIDSDLYDTIIEEISYVILGLTPENKFTDNIVSYGLDPDIAKIVYDKSKEVFFSKINLAKNGARTLNDDVLTQIGKKYSLSEEQVKNLTNLDNIYSVDTLINKLNISRLIAEQIVEDLDKKVLNNPQKKKNGDEPKPIVQMKNNLPEVRPDNVPMVEEGNSVSVPRFMPAGLSPKIEPAVIRDEKPEALHFTTIPKVEPKIDVAKNTISADPLSRINFAKNDSVSPITKEPEQKPAFVPKFGSTSFNDPLAQQAKPAPQSVIDSKMNGITGSQMEKPKPAAPVHEYVVDPYREPLV